MRKNSKSLRKSSPKKIPAQKECPKRRFNKQISPLNLQNSLYRKYSTSQNFYYISILNQQQFKDQSLDSTQGSQTQQFLSIYHRVLGRKHTFPRIKQVYKMHKQIPRMFQPGVKEILDKCYHRKRLLDYFKIAKVLGLRVESVNFSTFLLSMNDITNKKLQKQTKYRPIITQISSIDLSQEAQKDLLWELNGNKPKKQVSKMSGSLQKSNQNQFRCIQHRYQTLGKRQIKQIQQSSQNTKVNFDKKTQIWASKVNFNIKSKHLHKNQILASKVNFGIQSKL